MRMLHYVCASAELPPGSRKLVQAGGKSIGVFNIDGNYHALLNVCPHQFAPLCEGRVTGYCRPSGVGEFLYEREGEIVRCPWHGWEFDIKTGRSIFNPHKVRTASYKVHVEACHGAGQDTEARVETFPVQMKDSGIYVEV